MFSEVIDISLPVVAGLPVWPGDPEFRLVETARLGDGDSCNLSRLEMGVHCGTHVDAPRHFLADGTTVEALPLATLVGACLLVDLTAVTAIDAAALSALDLPAKVDRLLFKTANSVNRLCERPDFQPDFVALTADAAAWLVDRGVRLVGIDYLSIQRFHDDNRTHRILLQAGVVVVEGLNLAGVAPGGYDLTCLPLALVGAEGAPARVVLRR